MECESADSELSVLTYNKQVEKSTNKSLTELLIFKLCSLMDFNLFIKPVFKKIGRNFGNYKISFSSNTYSKILPVLQQ